MENFNKNSFIQNKFDFKKANINTSNKNKMIEKQIIKPKINNFLTVNKYNDSISTPSSISSISSSSSSSSSSASSFCLQNDSKYR